MKVLRYQAAIGNDIRMSVGPCSIPRHASRREIKRERQMRSANAGCETQFVGFESVDFARRIGWLDLDRSGCGAKLADWVLLFCGARGGGNGKLVGPSEECFGKFGMLCFCCF